MKIALVYDRVNKIGGAERVISSIHNLFPDAPLYTAVYNQKTAPWANTLKVHPSFLNHIPGARTRHELLPLLTPYAFEQFDLSAYDVVISVTSADAKAVITLPHQLHVCYLLTPTRYLWSHSQEYAGTGITGSLRRYFINRLRRWDLAAASRPDAYVAISEYIATRCLEYYHRPVETVIYPPVNTEYFKKNRSLQRNGKFLVVSRFVPYKRIDLAIKACNELQCQLVVVGDGHLRSQLMSIAGPTISFTGQINDSRLRQLYHESTALIFPQEEEFGIAAVEAQAAGIPVVAYKEGAAPELIRDGITGVLFENQSVESLKQALITLKNHTWYDKTIQEHAEQFSEQRFQASFKSFVEEAWQAKQRQG